MSGNRMTDQEWMERERRRLTVPMECEVNDFYISQTAVRITDYGLEEQLFLFRCELANYPFQITVMSVKSMEL